MARTTFFSFEYEDVSRAMVVRNRWVTKDRQSAGFIDAAFFEQLQKRDDAAVRDWIEDHLKSTTVTVVLVDEHTCGSKWVKYELQQGETLGRSLLVIDVSRIKGLQGRSTTRCDTIPKGYPFDGWLADRGYLNSGTWIEDAAKKVGK